MLIGMFSSIRFINLELHNDGSTPGKITCYFGRTNLRIYLRDVLDILNVFLSTHSKEMVVLQYNWKGTTINVLNDIFNEYSTNPKELIYAKKFTQPPFLSLLSLSPAPYLCWVRTSFMEVPLPNSFLRPK